jgi:hypothetical protein
MFCNKNVYDSSNSVGMCHLQRGHRGKCKRRKGVPTVMLARVTRKMKAFLPVSRHENSASVTLRSVPTLAQPPAERAAFISFLQHLMDRWQVGYIRYEQKNRGPHRRQKYLSRLKTELDTYVKTGNAEQLYNIAMYCYLETRAPEHKSFHFDNTVGSATRGRFKGSEAE